MIRIFVDSDVILDLLTKREPHYLFAAQLFSLVEENKITAYTSPIVIANIYYILTKLTNRTQSLKQIKKIMSFFKIAPVDEQIMKLAYDSGFNDFEDAIQYYAAKKYSIPIFVTRNKNDYNVKDISVCNAEEYMKMYGSQPKN